MSEDGETVSFNEACKLLNKPAPFVAALCQSGLLGYLSSDAIQLQAIHQFQKFGTQWTGVHPRNILAQLNTSLSGTVGTVLASAEAKVALRTDVSDDEDFAWIAQYYFKRNEFLFADPISTQLIGSSGILVDSTQLVEVNGHACFLCPSPDCDLALVMIWSNPSQRMTLDEAPEIADPIFDGIASRISFRHNLPLRCVQRIYIGVPSGVTRLSYFYRERDQRLDIAAILGRETEELSEIKALYSEALSNPDVFYKFLCLWKAFELARYYKNYLLSKRKDEFPFILFEEILPEGFEFQPHEKKKFGEIVNFFRTTHRNAIAHVSLVKGEMRRLFSTSDRKEVGYALPIFVHMVRTVVKNIEVLLEFDEARRTR